MTVTEAKEKLNELELKEFAYNHAMGILYYDGTTGAPKMSSVPRGKTMGVLAGEAYKISTDKEAVALLGFLREHADELDDETLRRVELREKDLKELNAVPLETYIEYTELMNEADAVWHEAKEKSDYPMFEPILKKVIDFTKLFAEKVAPEKSPYDYCLDKYEEGLTMAKCDDFFAKLRERIVPLVKKVQTSQQPDDACAKVFFPIEKQREFSDILMERIGIPRDRCAIGETEHPFTTDFSRNDVRITTHYYEQTPVYSMYSVIHEGGHALYELHTADALEGTNMAGGVSMSLHESQSRFLENYIGRSRAFIELIFPKLLELFPAQFEGVTAKQLWLAVNKAQPSLIRTEADELTYALHVLVRYEIEKGLFDGSIRAKDLQTVWNAKYKEYLGIDVPNDRQGVLQDSHWSQGNVGYFPSYALGSAYGAQMLAKMKQSVDVEAAVRSGDLHPVTEWLEQHIWKFGRLYDPMELLEKALGAPFDPKYFTDYLEEKYTGIYG
ncbi:MAG: carboxypeptidase M32, partial [Oscillospiraceae bacterium]|nr:carboxypeptidase M32 [Oscillospiraceae bacterium]